MEDGRDDMQHDGVQVLCMSVGIHFEEIGGGDDFERM